MNHIIKILFILSITFIDSILDSIPTSKMNNTAEPAEARFEFDSIKFLPFFYPLKDRPLILV